MSIWSDPYAFMEKSLSESQSIIDLFLIKASVVSSNFLLKNCFQEFILVTYDSKFLIYFCDNVVLFLFLALNKS